MLTSIFLTTVAAVTSAVLDHGGMTFDLQKLSAERFQLEPGGLTGGCERRDASAEPKRLAIRLEKSSFWKNRHGLAFRYRCRITKPGTDPKVTFVIRGCVKNEKGEYVRSQNDWATKIRETGNAWAVYHIPDTGIRANAEYCELLVDFNESLGSFEMKDIQSLPWKPSPESKDSKKYVLETRILGLDNFKTDYHLARGIACGIGYDWKVLEPKRKYSDRGWEVSLKLPAGVKLVSPCGADAKSVKVSEEPDGSLLVRYSQLPGWAPAASGWRGWRHPAVWVKSELPAGSRPGKVVFTPYYDGQPAAALLETELVMIEPFAAEAVPKRFYYGLNGDGQMALLSIPGTESEFARTLETSGLRGMQVATGSGKELEKIDGFHMLRSGYYLANGFNVNSHPPAWDRRPPEQRFVSDDPSYRPDLFKPLSCPIAIYNEESYFREVVLPFLREEFRDSRCDGFRANWEPNPFLGHGCMCARCRTAFADYLKVPEAEVAKDWPACVTPTGRYSQAVMPFRAKEHAKLVKTLHRNLLDVFGRDSEGLIVSMVWTALSGQTLECPRYPEIAAEEYAGDLKTVCAWGPYAWWDASVPYVREKRLTVAVWEAARTVREYVDRTFGAKAPRLQAVPHGRQGTNWCDWEGVPEWAEMGMDSFFFNRWDEALVYFFPMGYDARWWHAVSRAVTRAGLYEPYVLDGKRVDELTAVETVPEYAAPCTMVTAYLPKSRGISPLCTATYGLNGARIVAALNFWEEGEAFFTLRCRGLKSGESYTVVSDRRTLWTKDGGAAEWTAGELERGIFVQVGAARTKVFEIVPTSLGQRASRPLTEPAREAIDQASVRRAYEAARPALRKAADRDHEEERGRTFLIPDGTPVI